MLKIESLQGTSGKLLLGHQGGVGREVEGRRGVKLSIKKGAVE